MAHCPFELLDDLADVFAELRTWPGVAEKKPGVFYVKSQAFLHFHVSEGERRHADVKSRTGWVPYDLPRPATESKRRAFLRELRRRHAEK